MSARSPWVFSANIKEPGQATFQLEVRTVRRWLPIAAYRDGAEVHGLLKAKYVLFYGLGGMLLLFFIAIPFLMVAALMAVAGLLVAGAGLLQLGIDKLARSRGQ